MSTQRAFVIQFQPRTSATPERFEGRIEHVGSGAATHFASPAELLDFVSRLLGPPIREAGNKGTRAAGAAGAGTPAPLRSRTR